MKEICNSSSCARAKIDGNWGMFVCVGGRLRKKETAGPSHRRAAPAQTRARNTLRIDTLQSANLTCWVTHACIATAAAADALMLRVDPN